MQQTCLSQLRPPLRSVWQRTPSPCPAAQVVGDGTGSQSDRFIRTGQETWLQYRWLDLAEVVSDVGMVA